MSPAETFEPTEMPFGVRTRVGPKNHVLDGGPDLPWEEAILRWKRAARCKVQQLSAVSCARTAEPIEIPFGFVLRWAKETYIAWGCTLAQPGKYH